jgi:hypothetical protein
VNDKSEGFALPPLFVHQGSRHREGAASRPRLPATPPCEICGAAVLPVMWRRVCLNCGYLGGWPRL